MPDASIGCKKAAYSSCVSKILNFAFCICNTTTQAQNQLAFLEGLLALASFVFVDHDGTSFTVKATSLMVNRWPIAIVGTAQLSLEEV